MVNYTLNSITNAIAYSQMDNPAVKTLWNRFSLGEAALELTPCDQFVFRSGQIQLPTLEEGKEYALAVSSTGFAVVGKDYGGLMRGFFSLIMKIQQKGNAFVIDCVEEQSNYRLQNRMIHICVFPENDLYFLKKLIRLSALCQYTHVVIEFWGMLRYDCLKELSWPCAFSKEQIRELIQECRQLGMEPIPMSNQLGHATASRVCYGKHVVLDQNPKLQSLFTPDGWAWNIESDETKALLKNIRLELYDLFGLGSYMHIGCDEAYFITRNKELRQKLPQYLQELTESVEQEGRRPMLWMDMLLEKGAFPKCYTVGDPAEVEQIRNATAKSTVFVDWQYSCADVPIPSLASLKDCGRDVMGAPWYDPQNYQAHVQTIEDCQMHGIMLTTWHTLKQYMGSILGCAKAFGAVTFPWSEFSGLREETATLLRRLSFEGNAYEDCGWSKEQIEV